MIKIIFAVSRNGWIGRDDKLAWDIPEELKFFKKQTSGNSVVFGRTTFEGMGSRPLPNRTNYVLTSNKEYKCNGVTVINDFDKLIDDYKGSKKVLFICGGKKVYEQCQNIADEIIISTIDIDVDGNIKAPEIDLSNYEVFNTEKYDQFTVTYYKMIK